MQRTKQFFISLKKGKRLSWAMKTKEHCKHFRSTTAKVVWFLVIVFTVNIQQQRKKMKWHCIHWLYFWNKNPSPFCKLQQLNILLHWQRKCITAQDCLQKCLQWIKNYEEKEMKASICALTCHYAWVPWESWQTSVATVSFTKIPTGWSGMQKNSN